MTPDRPALPARLSATAETAFVGRREELAVFEEVWAAVGKSHRQIVFLGGEPGVGKSWLAAQVARVLYDHDALVLVGASSVDLEVPFGPFVEALGQLLVGTPPGALATQIGEHAPELCRLTAQVRRHVPDVVLPPAPAGDPRRVLFDAVTAFLVRLAADRPVVLVLEDVQWSGQPTLQLLRHIGEATARTRLLVIATLRTTAADRSAELTYTIADLYRLAGVRRLDLEGLSTDDIAEYLLREAGLPATRARAAAAVLRDQTAGNPFFLRELWRDLAVRGGIDVLRQSGFRAPRSVRDTLGRRLADLSAPHLRALEAAAVLGDEFPLADLLGMAGDRTSTLEVIDLAAGLGLLEADDRRPGRYRFVHALVRQAVIDGIPPARRAALHVRAAEVLERPAPADPMAVARLAYHYACASPLGFADKAVHYLVAAAEHAESSSAFEEAAALYVRAADLSAVTGPGRAELLLAAADSHRRAGEFAAALECYGELATSADGDVALRAAVGYEDVSWRPGHRGEQAVALLTAALRRRPVDADDPDTVWALASLSRALLFTGAVADARRVGDRALALARRVGRDELLAHALHVTLWQGLEPARVDEQQGRVRQLAQLTGDHDDPDAAASAAYFASACAYLRGDPRGWASALSALAHGGQRTGQPFFRYMTGCVAGGHAFARGDFEAAARTADELLELGAAFAPDGVDGSYGVQMFMVQRATGELERVRPLISGEETTREHWAPALLALYTELDLRTPARRVLTELLAETDDLQTVTSSWPGVLAFLVESALALRDVDAAASLRPLVLEYAGCNLVMGQFVAVFGSADRYLGALDSLLGEAGADDHFQRALTMDRHMGADTHVAETLARWAEHIARQPGSRAAAQATAMRSQAREIAERTGNQRILRWLGERTAAAGRELPDGLTGREADVLRLLADGLSNREIGARLFISQNTAANHIRSILLKTGASNRTQAAMYAAARDLAN